MKHKPRSIAVDWLNTIWKTDLPPHAKYLACYLRKYMNSQQDMAWPSYSTIQGETGLSSATVSKYLEVLESEGWLSREKGGPKKNTKYWAAFPHQISTLVDKVPEQISTSPAKVGTLGAKADSTLGAKEELNNSNKQVNKQYAHFDDFWKIYPKKTDKLKAKKKWDKLKPSEETLLLITKNIRLRIDSGSWSDPQYIPHPTTYLNGERWNDEITARTTHNGQRKESLSERSARETAAALARIEAEEANSCPLGANDATVWPQVGEPGRAPHDGERRLFDGVSTVVPKDGAFD